MDMYNIIWRWGKNYWYKNSVCRSFPPMTYTVCDSVTSFYHYSVVSPILTSIVNSIDVIKSKCLIYPYRWLVRKSSPSTQPSWIYNCFCLGIRLQKPVHDGGSFTCTTAPNVGVNSPQRSAHKPESILHPVWIKHKDIFLWLWSLDAEFNLEILCIKQSLFSKILMKLIRLHRD